MKCTNCGAEIKDGTKFCEFCGSQISSEMIKEREALNKACCPKCGSTNIKYTREKNGEVKSKKGTAISRSTVALCQDCGNTWNTDTGSTKKRRTGLWILGWIFLFPVPLTIIIARSKKLDKKWKAIIIAALWLFVLLVGLLNKDDDEDIDTTEVSVSSVEEIAENTTEQDTEENKIESETTETTVGEETDIESKIASSDVSISEAIVYDVNDIKITATSLEDGWLGTELKLLIENNSSQNITVQARNANVNGYMVDTLMSVDVASGKKANDELTFETSGLKDCGIETIASMEFSFHIFDSDSWEEILDTEVIRIDTSAYGSYTQTYDDSGNVVVDTNGVKIVGKGLSENDSFWGPGVILYIENNSDQDITVQVRDVSINGFMVTSSMSEDVVIGKKAISAVQFFSSDLEDNAITEIENVEFYFHIFNMDSFETIFDSDIVIMNFVD